MRRRSDARRLIAATLAATAAVAVPLLVSAGAGALAPSLGDLVVGAAFAAAAVLVAGRGTLSAVCLGAASVIWVAVLLAPLSSFSEALERFALVPHSLLIVAVIVSSDPRMRGPRSRVLSAAALTVALLAGIGVLRPALFVLGVIAIAAGLHRWRPAVSALQLLSGVTLVFFQLVVLAGAGSPTALANVLDLALIVIAVATAGVVVRERDLWRTIRSESAVKSGDPFGDRLGSALGAGRTLVALRMSDGSLADSTGAPVIAPPSGTPILDDAGEVIAIIAPHLVLDQFVASPLRALLTRASDLAALRRSLRDRATELESSRRLLLHAADAERDELQRRVVEEVASRIDAVATRLRPVSPHLAERARVTASELAHREFGIPAKGSLPELLSHFAAERVTVESAILSADGIPPAVVRAAWFTCAEAVVNARKHAPGSSISIVARASAGLLRIEIRDTGPGGADEHGAGLRGLADRAEDLGGRLRVQSGPAGTRVQWAVPLDARSPALWIPASESRVTPDSKGSAPLLRSAP